jgi:hypothetical protein
MSEQARLILDVGKAVVVTQLVLDDLGVAEGAARDDDSPLVSV